jgi:HEAT repeat protein
MAGWKTVVWQSFLTVAVAAVIFAFGASALAYLKREGDAQRERSDRTAVEQSMAVLEEVLGKPREAPGICDQYAEDEGREKRAIEDLRRRTPAATSVAIPVLIRSLKSINPSPADAPMMGGRAWINAPAAAREALVRIGPIAIPHLKEATKDADAMTRVQAARALWELEGNADEVLPVLWEAWLDQGVYQEDTNVRIEAGRGLSEVGPTKKEWLVPALSSHLCGDSTLAFSAARTLFEMTPAVPEALPPLSQAIKCLGAWRMRQACDPSRIGMRVKAVPVLERALAHEDPELRAWAAYGLGQTFQPEVVPILVTATTDRNAEVRLAAVRGLDSLHTHAGPAIPALEKLLADPDEAVRERAKEVLDRLMRK